MGPRRIIERFAYEVVNSYHHNHTSCFRSDILQNCIYTHEKLCLRYIKCVCSFKKHLCQDVNTMLIFLLRPYEEQLRSCSCQTQALMGPKKPKWHFHSTLRLIFNRQFTMYVFPEIFDMTQGRLSDIVAVIADDSEAAYKQAQKMRL